MDVHHGDTATFEIANRRGNLQQGDRDLRQNVGGVDRERNIPDLDRHQDGGYQRPASQEEQLLDQDDQVCYANPCSGATPEAQLNRESLESGLGASKHYLSPCSMDFETGRERLCRRDESSEPANFLLTPPPDDDWRRESDQARQEKQDAAETNAEPTLPSILVGRSWSSNAVDGPDDQPHARDSRTQELNPWEYYAYGFEVERAQEYPPCEFVDPKVLDKIDITFLPPVTGPPGHDSPAQKKSAQKHTRSARGRGRGEAMPANRDVANPVSEQIPLSTTAYAGLGSPDQDDAHERDALGRQDTSTPNACCFPPVARLEKVALGQIEVVDSQDCMYCTFKINTTHADGFHSVDEFISSLTICEECKFHRYLILQHFCHGEWVDTPSNLTHRAEEQRTFCSVCSGLGLFTCKRCPLRVCVNCQVILDQCCAGRVDKLIQFLSVNAVLCEAVALWPWNIEEFELPRDRTF